MTSSSKARRISEIIEEVTDLISEDHIRELCEEPITQALMDFDYDSETEIDHALFLKITGRFVQHIFAQAWNPRQQLSLRQARAEAIRMLQNDYRGNAGFGLEGAYLDAIDPIYDGLGFVLKQMAEILSAKARQNHLGWVFGTRLDTLDWAVRREVANELLKRWKRSSPGTAPAIDPAQATDHCAELLTALVSAEAQVTELLSSQRNLIAG